MEADVIHNPENSFSLSSLRHFYKKNSGTIFVCSILFLLFFLPYLANTSIGVDSHISIETPGTTYNWLEIGRQGGILINKAFLRGQFSMLYVEAAAYLLYILSFVIFAFLFDHLANVPAWKTCLFFLFFMVHPIWTEQLYFTMMIFPIAFGVALVPLVLYFAYSKKPILWGFAVALMVLIFSIYQTFAIVYIAGCVLCFLLSYVQKIRSNELPTTDGLLKLGLRQVLLFAIAFLINTLITKAFFLSSDYLTGQIQWGKVPLQTCLQEIYTHIIQVLTGDGIFYTPAFSLSLLALAAGTILFFLRYRQATAKWIPILAILFLQTTPFLLTIYGGNIPVFRSQFILPFTTGCNFLLFLVLALSAIEGRQWKQPFIGVSVFVLALTLSWQYYPASQLQYSTALVQQNDLQLAYAIGEELTKTTEGCTKPVLFVGCASLPQNPSFVFGETAQKSLFGYGWETSHPYELTGRAVSYMNALGFPIRAASEDLLYSARSIAQSMPAFPVEGSIRETEDFILIKLGADDSFAPNLMTPENVLVQSNPLISFDDTLHGSVNDCFITDGILSVSGWIMIPYHNSNYVIPGVHLWDEENQILYTLNSGTVYTSELTDMYQGTTDFSHSGVTGKALVNQLPENSKDCKILLSVTTLDGTLYLDTNTFLRDRIAS